MTLFLQHALGVSHIACTDGTNLRSEALVQSRETPFLGARIERLLAKDGRTLDDVRDMLFVAGPGGYTGLRTSTTYVEALRFVDPSLTLRTISTFDFLRAATGAETLLFRQPGGRYSAHALREGRWEDATDADGATEVTDDLLAWLDLAKAWPALLAASVPVEGPLRPEYWRPPTITAPN